MTDQRDLMLAAMRLSNEVLASLPLMEPLCRREFGNTNYNLLIQRAEELANVVRQIRALAKQPFERTPEETKALSLMKD